MRPNKHYTPSQESIRGRVFAAAVAVVTMVVVAAMGVVAAMVVVVVAAVSPHRARRLSPEYHADPFFIQTGPSSPISFFMGC